MLAASKNPAARFNSPFSLLLNRSISILCCLPFIGHRMNSFQSIDQTFKILGRFDSRFQPIIILSPFLFFSASLPLSCSILGLNELDGSTFDNILFYLATFPAIHFQKNIWQLKCEGDLFSSLLIISAHKGASTLD